MGPHQAATNCRDPLCPSTSEAPLAGSTSPTKGEECTVLRRVAWCGRRLRTVLSCTLVVHGSALPSHIADRSLRRQRARRTLLASAGDRVEAVAALQLTRAPGRGLRAGLRRRGARCTPAARPSTAMRTSATCARTP